MKLIPIHCYVVPKYEGPYNDLLTKQKVVNLLCQGAEVFRITSDGRIQLLITDVNTPGLFEEPEVVAKVETQDMQPIVIVEPKDGKKTSEVIAKVDGKKFEKHHSYNKKEKTNRTSVEIEEV